MRVGALDRVRTVLFYVLESRERLWLGSEKIEGAEGSVKHVMRRESAAIEFRECLGVVAPAIMRGEREVLCVYSRAGQCENEAVTARDFSKSRKWKDQQN